MKRFLTHTTPVLLLLALVFAFWNPPAAQAQWDGTCYQPTRLGVHQQGRVTTYPNLPNRLRASSGYDGQIIGRIPAGGVFAVIGSPVCEDGLNWWLVQYNNIVGWTAEGNGYNTYWVEPISHQPVPAYCTLQPRLVNGLQGQVTPGLPNVVRTAPGTTASGANSQVIGEIPAGGVFQVINGPQCGPDGRYWWLVNYNGLQGWTAEGEGSTYWLLPYNYPHIPVAQCEGQLPSRLIVGQSGSVTSYPNLPNTVRSGPASTSPQLGQIPVGGIFQVLSGPYCNNGAWYQVNYGNLIGWTLESGGGNYWLQPQ